MLVGFSGWWTPFPKDDEKAKKYLGQLLYDGVKIRTTRVDSPHYQKIQPGTLLHLWWKKLQDIGTKDLDKLFEVFETGYYVTLKWEGIQK